MKMEYTWFIELKDCATELGLTETKQNVDCSKEWWDEHHAIITKKLLFCMLLRYELIC
jgi:hypothetical protein